MINHVGTKPLETKRLILRRYELSDAEDMFNNFANNENVSKFLSWYPHENVETTKKLLISWIEEYKNDNRYVWAIVLKKMNQVIGSISVVGMSEKHQTAELGYSIGEAYWGKGIATKQSKLL